MPEPDPYAALAKPIDDPYAAIAKPINQSAPEPPHDYLYNAENRIGESAATGWRELAALGHTIVGIPPALYHAFTDPETPEEKKERESKEAAGNTMPNDPISRGVYRMTGQPVNVAADWYKQAAQGKIPDAYGQALSVAPEAIGGAGGAVIAGKLAEAAPGAIKATVEKARNLDLPATAQTVAAKTPILKSFVDGPPADLVTRAVKPGKNNIGWNDAVAKALPNIKAAEQQLGHPIAGLDDALDAVTLAKKQVWQQYADRLGPAAKMGAQIDGNEIADAMVKSIDTRTALQNPGLMDRVTKTADTYRRPLGMNEAEDFLQSANKDLNSYYAKNKVGRQVARNDPEMASTVAEAEALRQSLYVKLDELSGPGAFDLKRQYGALTNVERELTGRQNVAARQQPQSLQEQLITARGYGKVAKGVLTLNPGDVVEGAESIAASKWLKERNTTDALITRAFEKVQPSQPMPAPMRPMIRGLLPRGPIPLGSGPDTSGSVPFTPPAFNNTTRAQRLGLLLPERAMGHGLFDLMK
ncbi:MAG: hypothetical protein WCC22_08670 [Terriglobales bacterium]